MVQEGLRLNGRWDLARDLATKYLNAVLDAYTSEQTITENLAPDSPKGYGMKDFVGWGGIGPISNLIEYILGFQVNAQENSVEWHVQRTDRHGINGLPVANTTASIICEQRPTTSDSCHIGIESDGEFTLRIIREGKSSSHHIHRGRNQIVAA
jgi:hypothetical protein